MIEFKIFHFSVGLNETHRAEMKTPFQPRAEMESIRTFRHSQKSDRVSPTNTSNLLLNLVTKKIGPKQNKSHLRSDLGQGVGLPKRP